MNKIYRVIWNNALQAWVAVSEIAKGKTKSSRSAADHCYLADSKITNAYFHNFKLNFITISILGVLGVSTQVSAEGYEAGGGKTTDVSKGVAIGHEAIVDNNGFQDYRGGVAIGDGTKARVDGSTNIDTSTRKKSNLTPIAINEKAEALSDGAIAIGELSSVKEGATGSIALGAEAKVTADTKGAVALGRSSEASRKALTANAGTSTETTAANNTVYAIGTASQSDKNDISSTVKGDLAAVSVGNETNTRQIINVAAGSENTDAVNVAQLKAVANTPITFAGNVNNDTDAAGVYIAKDGTQRTLGQKLNILGGATGDSSNSNVKTVVSDGKVDIQLLNAPIFTGVVKGHGFDASGQKITNVAEGEELTDAVNFGQLLDFGKLIADATEITSDDKSINLKSKSDSTTGITTYDVGVNTDDKTVVKDATTGVISVKTGSITSDSVGVATTSDANTIATTGSVAEAINNSGFTVKENNNGGQFIKTGGTVNFIDGDNIVITRSGADFTIATKPEVSFNSVSVGSASPVVINSAGINAGDKKITNVADGVDDTDAVNFGQLLDFGKLIADGTEVTSDDKSIKVVSKPDPKSGITTYDVGVNTDDKTVVKDATTGVISVKTGDITSSPVGVATASDANTIATTGSIAQAINNSGFTVKANSDSGQFIKTGEAVNFVNGKNIAIVRSGADFTIDTKPDVSFNSVSVGGTNPVVINNAGINAGDKKITNVAAGTADTDAVNFGQLTSMTTGSKEVVTSDDKSIKVASKSDPTTGIITYDVGVNTDDKTVVKDATTGVISVKTGDITSSAVGVATAPNVDTIATAGSIAQAINNSGFTVKANSDAGQFIKTGEAVNFIDGKNIAITRSGADFTIATKPEVSFNSVSVGGANPVVINNAGINAGDKKITNVAAGTADTDAVNFGQLKGTNTNIVKGFNIAADKGIDDNVQLGETIIYTSGDKNIVTTARNNEVDFSLAPIVNIGSNLNGNPIVINGNTGNIGGLSNKTFDANNFVSGQAATEDQLAQVATQAKNANKGWKLSANGDSTSQTDVKPENVVDFSASDNNIKIGKSGNDIKVGLAGDITVDSVTAGNTVMDNKGITISNGPKNTVSLTNKGLDNGNNIITNVASGLQGHSLDDIKSQGATSPQWTNAATIGDLTQVQGAVNNVTQNVTNIENIVGGDDNTHIEGGKLTDAGKKALTTYNVAGDKIKEDNTIISAIHNMNEEGIKFFHTNDETVGSDILATGTSSDDSNAAGKYSTAIGVRASVGEKAENGIAIGNGATVKGMNSIAVGVGNIVEGKRSGAFGDPNYIMGQNGENVPVEGSYAVGNDNVINSSNTFVLGNNVNNSGTTKDKKPVAIGNTVENSVYLGNKTSATAGSSVGTRNLKSDGKKGNTTTAGDTGVVNSASVNGMTYGGFAGAKANGVVSVGASGSERRIQNVAAGEISPTSTDAINGSQLYQSMQNFGVGINQYINDVDQRAQAGIASAMATATLPQAYLPGKSMVAVGTSYYRGESAIAVGVSSISDNGRWVVKGSANVNSEDAGVNVGVGYQW